MWERVHPFRDSACSTGPQEAHRGLAASAVPPVSLLLARRGTVGTMMIAKVLGPVLAVSVALGAVVVEREKPRGETVGEAVAARVAAAHEDCSPARERFRQCPGGMPY